MNTLGIIKKKRTAIDRLNCDKRVMYDSEIEKIIFAERAKEKRTHGFEGCTNAECTRGCFYLQTYSPEGLCSDCEFAAYPERYVGCPFCRCQQKISYVC